MLKHVRFTVKGKVQGVFYRASAKLKADELGVTGLVRNLPDGSVYIEAEGTTESLDIFCSWCNVGPPRAEVSVMVTIDGDLQHYKDFRVVR